MLYYLNSFYIYSFFGYILELILKTFIFKGINSGILYGPWLPIYGIGAIIVIFIERLIFKKTKLPRIIKIILIFIIVAILLSTIEYLGGLFIELVFHRTFWNYNDMKYNIGKYTSLEMAMIWGVFSLFLIYVIKPLIDKFIKKIPIPVTVLVSIIFLIDVILTFTLN